MCAPWGQTKLRQRPRRGVFQQIGHRDAEDDLRSWKQAAPVATIAGRVDQVGFEETALDNDAKHARAV